MNNKEFIPGETTMEDFLKITGIGKYPLDKLNVSWKSIITSENPGNTREKVKIKAEFDSSMGDTITLWPPDCDFEMEYRAEGAKKSDQANECLFHGGVYDGKWILMSEHINEIRLPVRGVGICYYKREDNENFYLNNIAR